MDDDPRDEMARLRAQSDQARESTKEIVSSLHGFYADLVERGFTEDQAFEMTLKWMEVLNGPGSRP